MENERPNILLLMTDQQRGDALGIEDHPVLQTPYLDQLASHGIRFRKGYTACPVCIPARRTLMTGKKPASHGVLMNHNTWLNGPTLPEKLHDAGYQTHLVGKLHLWPHRKLYGFGSADWSDAPRSHYPDPDDYERFLTEQGVSQHRPAEAHGANINGWVARPWHLDESLHFSNWCADKALEFLERRDPTLPFFLKVSFFHPHQSCTPPQVYWDRYMNMELPEPCVGEWARVFDGPQRGLPVASWRTALDPQVMKQYRAGYYGSINHIDDQIGRILNAIPRNTLIVFVSDHGEMLGDHQWIRKRNAFEPSARIPFLFSFPSSMPVSMPQVRNEPVELMDVMPTLLEAAGTSVPDSVEGRSILPLIRDEQPAWRDYIHGECSEVPSLNSGMQYLTDGRIKYIWYPGIGQEQLFDVEADPQEMEDLAEEPEYEETLRAWRITLARELAGRPEHFSDGECLYSLNGPTAKCLESVTST